jgi:hypothetical protein
MHAEDPAYDQHMQEHLAAAGSFPAWEDEHLQPLISDDALRTAVLAEVGPRQLEYFTQELPAPPGWQDKPCAYWQLSEPYTHYARQAAGHAVLSWATQRRPLEEPCMASA